MKALIYTYQGEEFYGTMIDPKFPYPVMNGSYEVIHLGLEDGTDLRLRAKDIRAIITDQPSAALVIGDPTSSDDAPLPSEQPEESSAPTDT